MHIDWRHLHIAMVEGSLEVRHHQSIGRQHSQQRAQKRTDDECGGRDIKGLPGERRICAADNLEVLARPARGHFENACVRAHTKGWQLCCSPIL